MSPVLPDGQRDVQNSWVKILCIQLCLMSMISAVPSGVPDPKSANTGWSHVVSIATEVDVSSSLALPVVR